MLRIVSKINHKKYVKLMHYALLRCDVMTFALPDFNSSSVEDIGSKEFLEYKNSINSLLNKINPFIKKIYADNRYFSSEGDNYLEIYELYLNECVIEAIISAKSLYSWVYPDMPEDLCLFSKQKCWLKSVAHEKYCWIYTDSDIEKDILKKLIGLKYYDDRDDEIPTLDNK